MLLERLEEIWVCQERLDFQEQQYHPAKKSTWQWLDYYMASNFNRNCVICETLLENMVVLIGVNFYKIIRGKFQEPFFGQSDINFIAWWCNGFTF